VKTLSILIISFLVGLSNLIFANDSWMLYDDTQIDVIEITIDPVDLNWIYEHVESDSIHLVTVHYSNEWINETVDSVGFRLRGNTSRQAAKKSFKLDFNHFFSGRDFYDVEKINLNGEHNDPSIVRSKLCWDLFQDIQLSSSRATHAAVYINGDYYGLYISIEHIDDTFLEKSYSDDSGNLWKCLWPADLTYRGNAPEDYHPYYGDDRPYDLKTNRDLFDYTKLARLIRIINQTPDHSFADSLENVLYVDEVLKYFAMNILVGGWDDYWFLMNNYYLYHEPDGDRFHWIPYDYDNTFGIDWFNVDWTSTNPYNFPVMNGGDRPLIERLMGNDQYRDLYTHFIEFFLENVYNNTILESRINTVYSSVYPWAQMDEFRTLDYGFTLDDFTQSYFADSYQNQHVKRGLLEFVNARTSSLSNPAPYTGAPPIIYDLDWHPKYPQPEDSIYVTIAAFGSNGISNITLRYYDNPVPVWTEYPMEYLPITGTKLVENIDRWVGVLPPLGVGITGYFDIVAEDNAGQTQVYPRNRKITVNTPSDSAPPLFINEFLARNNSINSDEFGEFDDWIELYNDSDTDIDLSGMFLTDKADNLTKWAFPDQEIIIPSQGFILIWCDEDQEQGFLHTNFKLSGNGEFIALVSSDGITIIDSVTFGAQTPDISFGRLPDGSDQWTNMNPTPTSANIDLSVDDTVMPKSFSVKVFPNPFNPITNIAYTCLNEGLTLIEVYNISGRKIDTIVQEFQQQGMYNVIWNADRFSSGIYFIHVKSNRFIDIQKVILLK